MDVVVVALQLSGINCSLSWLEVVVLGVLSFDWGCDAGGMFVQYEFFSVILSDLSVVL